MVFINLDNLTLEDVGQIYQTHRESNTLEYKRDLQIDSEKDTKEFLADVSSFANANGGTIFYGIDEVGGLVGLKIPELDSFRLRVQQKIEEGILPRPGFKIKYLEISVNKYIFIIQVHKSFSGPHAVKSSDQYYYRSDAGKRRMDHFQLKNAFLQSNSLKEEIENFCNRKVSEILLKQTPVQLSDEAVVAMFLIPINSWNDEIIVEPAKLKDSSSGFQIMDFGVGHVERNFDGFMIGNHNKGYLQLFRNGTILSVFKFYNNK
ncbi:MAG: ATP-binding protein [Saprospiraceae bacterium]|nr:ATP-binding protein [Candidatus Opimibacter skivensis]